VHTQNNQEFIVDPGFAVAELKIDPEYWLVSKSEEVVQTQYIENPSEFAVYPNPFKDDISVSFSNQNTPVQLNLFNAQGKLIKLLNPTKKNFNLSYLSDGLYIIQLKTADEILERKIIKH